MILLGIILLVVTQSYCMDDLPGVDEIASGYDAAKMLSAGEQNSKFRIFDLSDQNQNPFKIKIIGTDRTFTRPRLVHITDISVRRESTCESVSYSFESFYRSYFRSTSFGFHIGTPEKLSLSIGYSQTLTQIHESMTKKNKAVGISQVWWALYSIQIGPPFLMKLDPMFTQSVDLLVTEASNPSNEDHQTYYNQFIQTFGTHYVSRVIVGGTIYLYTLVDSNYHKTYSYRETTSQISVMFQYKKFGGQYGTSSVEISQQLKETFKNSADTLSVFQPPVASQDNKTDWQVWQQRAGEHPVVVNRTIFPIHSLIRNNQIVREHLRRTIQFYVEKGEFPTFAQLNGRSTARGFSIPNRPIGPINGLDVVGCGYDVLLMESKSCIFDQSNFTDHEQWSDPNNKSLTYSIPNGWLVVNTLKSLTMDGSMLINSAEDYFRSTATVQIGKSGGWLGIGRRRRQATITEFYRRYYQDYYNLVLRMKQIGWYTLSVSAFPYPKLNSVVQTALDSLPKRFDVQDINIWQGFFNTFGTHVVVSSNMGGQVWAETWYEKCLTHENTLKWIDEQLSNNWAIFRTDINKLNNTKAIDERFARHSIFSSQLLGGNESIKPSEWEKWVPTIKTRPLPISYHLISFDEILPSSDLRHELKAAITYILNTAENEERHYISRLESLRGPSKTQCI